MAWVLLHLGLLSCFSGIHSQPTVTQPASASVSLGETVKLSCTRSSGGSWDPFSWYQQKPGQAPRFVLYSSSTRGEGIPDRFTGSASGKTGYLTITNAQAEDEGHYYCAALNYATRAQYHGGKEVEIPSRYLPEAKSDASGELTMAWAVLFLALLSFLSGIRSQLRVTPPASASVSQGGTVTMSCTRRSDGSWDSVSWIQQRPEHPPRFLLHGSSTRGEGIPDRFSGSASGNTVYLTITNAQPEDEADYYCAEWDNTSRMFIFGSGIRFTITGQPPAPPKVHLFPPSQEQLKIKGKGTLVCLVKGFRPKTVQVNWQADGKAISSGVQTSEPTKQGDKYMATSYLTVTPSDWENHQRYSCIVTHEGKTFEEVVKPSTYP
ncbi:immunoglobulin lambda-1 light chain-like [Pogona vitticeps]